MTPTSAADTVALFCVGILSVAFTACCLCLVAGAVVFDMIRQEAGATPAAHVMSTALSWLAAASVVCALKWFSPSK